jgi:glycosyltransferase involved in cell wall biosynthesis/SAM-dependent methyltransferase
MGGWLPSYCGWKLCDFCLGDREQMSAKPNGSVAKPSKRAGLPSEHAKVVAKAPPKGRKRKKDVAPDPARQGAGQASRVCLLVLGVHRSGTSALTRVLSLHGATLPRRLMGGGEGNTAGHWEGARLVQYSDQILAEFGTDWADWRLLDMSLLPVARRLQIKADIRQIVEEDYGDAGLIVLKDPRICRFPGFFMEALAESGYRVVPVIANRNPLEVIESLQKREVYWPDHMRRSDAALLWLSHQLEVERATRAMDRVFVGYNELLSDWKTVMERIEREGAIRFPLQPDMAAREVGEFLTPARRSHRHTVSDVRLEPDLHGWVADTYEALQRLEDGRDPAAQMRTLDRIYHEYRATAPLLTELTAERRKMQGDATRFHAEADTMRQEVDRLAAEAAALIAAQNEAELRSRQADAELEGLRGDVQARQQQLEALLAEKQALEASVQDLLERVRQLEARLAQSAAEIADANAEAQKLAEAKALAEAAAAGLRDQLESISHDYELAAREAAEAHNTSARLQAGAQQIVGLLNAARDDTYRAHLAYRQSTSWRLTAPLRWVSSLVRGRSADPVQPVPLRYEDHFGPNVLLPTDDRGGSRGTRVSGQHIVFFTICSRNFMAFARTLHKSLTRFYPQARLVVALCDEAKDHPPFVAADEPFEFLYLDDLDIPDWHGMSRRYNVTEFNTAIKPFVFLHLFERQKADFVVYFDPDIYVVDHLTEIEEAFGKGADVILTPHMLEPNERAEMNERRLLQYGIYNLGFVGIARTAKAVDVVRWWGRRLERECIIKRDEGLFVDQKWADHFPAFFARPHILHHPGYNIAYWNLSNRKMTWGGNRWLVNGVPARFVHFSGNNLDDPSVLSRHSGEHRADTIGEMKTLLDEYRTEVFANGHAEFRKIPYAFNWGGASGFNEHTPKPVHEMASGSVNEARQGGAVSAPRQASNTEILRTAMDIVGGPGKLLTKTARVISRGDLSSLKRGIDLARSAAQERRRIVERALAQPPSDALVDWQPFRKSILVIEWKTPRPDSDSGSRTVFYTAEILALLGYRVTFLPLSLIEDGAYSRALADLGVRCIDASVYPSVRAFFEAEGASFDFVMLNRVSVVASQMDQIKASCPQAKLIFNTVDLHFVRELRDAEMNNLPVAAALQTKAQELAIVRDSAMTIVLSHVEEEILRAEVPEADIHVMPLIFSELDADPPDFDARSDILFIGSFPHKPNVDAVLYFADEIFPTLRERIPDLRFHVVGSEPTPEVLRLSERPGIIVHGFVADVAPLFRSVRLTVAPLRFGAGIKGKIATSLSFGVPCVCTPIAAEGMRINDGRHVLIADTVEEWCEAVTSLYSDRDRWTQISAQARQIAVDEFSLAANELRIGSMMEKLDPGAARGAFLRFATQEEFATFWAAHPDILASRVETEKALLPAAEEAFDIDGFCAVCGEQSKFATSFMYSAAHYESGEKSPNWREHLACWGCGFTMRLRASMQLFLSRVYRGADSAVYITEQTTPLFRWLQSIHPSLEGSEYLGDACAFGTIKDGLRNEDLTALTYADASFDAILSFDVLEHVTDDVAAFRECFRCLRPGGTLLFTAPFAYDKGQKVVRARMTDGGTIEHILPPEYHGNPVDPEGALCFRYFAWDVVEDLKSVGFETVEVVNYWSRDFAYLGDFGFIIIARKSY